MKAIWISLLSLLPVFLFVACSDVKLPAIGRDDEILVFTDDSTWAALEPAILQTFEDTVFTPQPERWYVIRRVPFGDFSRYEKEKNRIVLAPLDGSGRVASFVQQSLEPSVRQLILDGKEYVFNKYDSKARGQLLMFLVGANIPSLKAVLETKATDLLYYFKSMSLKRDLAGLVSERSYQKLEIERSLLDRHGWTMTVQHDYHVAIDSSEGRFFWVRRANPTDMERWIFVSWIDAPNPKVLTDKYAINLRDSLTRQHLRTVGNDAYVEIAPYNLEIQNVNFLGRFAYEIRGNWRFSDKSGGGPFVNYTLYDERSRRIYTVDGSIFAPRVEKKKLILQVDAILHTFRTANELSEEDRDELGY
jgi:hypothetical protein